MFRTLRERHVDVSYQNGTCMHHICGVCMQPNARRCSQLISNVHNTIFRSRCAAYTPRNPRQGVSVHMNGMCMHIIRERRMYAFKRTNLLRPYVDVRNPRNLHEHAENSVSQWIDVWMVQRDKGTRCLHT